MGQFLFINTNYAPAVFYCRNSAIVCKYIYIYFSLEISGQPTSVCVDWLFPAVATVLFKDRTRVN